MRVTRPLIGSIAFMLLTLAVAPDARGCSCMSIGPPCQNYFQVDAVFASTVQSISQAPDDDPPFRKLRVEFALVTASRGIHGATVTVFTADSGAACGYTFKKGELYLVYAYRTTDGARLETGICTRTRPLAEAGDDLQFLQALAASVGGGRVYGSVAHWERDLGSGTSRDYGRVADVLVTLHGTGRTFEARTDERGRYEVSGLPPGKYEIRAFPPPAFSTRYLERSVELRDPRACFVADFTLRYDGRISGLLRTSTGAPGEGAHVDVMAAERVGSSGNIETLRTVADAGGHFELTEVPPRDGTSSLST